MPSFERIAAHNAARLQELARVDCGYITDLRWSPNGLTLAVAHAGGVWVWRDGFGGPPTLSIEDGHDGPVKGIAFSPDGRVLATASADTTVRLWLVETGARLTVLRTHTDGVDCVAFDPRGGLLASGGRDQTVRLTDLAESVRRVTLQGHTREVTGVVFGLGGRVLASCGWDSTVRLWDVSDPRLRATLPHDDWVRGLAVSPDGRLLASASKDSYVRLWDIETGALRLTLPAHADGADCASFSVGGALQRPLLATGGRDDTIKIWEIALPPSAAPTGHLPPAPRSTGNGDVPHPIVRLDAHHRPVLALGFNPAGTLLASGSGDNTIRLWGVLSDS